METMGTNPLIASNAKSAKLRISNPTKRTAQTSVLVEDKKHKLEPWTENQFFGKRKVVIPANETIVITVNAK